MKSHVTLAFMAALVATSAFASSSFTSNDVKYKDSSRPKATGRSADATIEAQALLGRDGAADLEITAAGGTIEKVQVKLPGDVTHNFAGLSGASFVQRLEGLAPRDAVDVQVNVQTPGRVGVVSLTDTVKLRPDLQIGHVGAPPHALRNAPYTITATVQESNGDVGARASCVLFANGAEVDRVDGLWLDAGGTVTCEMTHTFRAAGNTQLSVAIEGVAPGDYDSGNNASAPVSVRVYERASYLDEWMASAYEETFNRRSWFRSPTSESETLHYGWGVGVGFWTLFRSDGLDVNNLRASVHASTDGRLIHEVKDVQFRYRTYYDDWEDVTSRCAYATYDDRYSGVTACRHTSPWEPTRVTFQYRMNAGSVTYVSRGWYQTYVGSEPSGVYYWNTVWPSEWGNRFELGNTATVSVQFSDGARYFDQSATMDFWQYERNAHSPDSCSPDGQYCSGYTDYFRLKDGIAGNW